MSSLVTPEVRYRRLFVVTKCVFLGGHEHCTSISCLLLRLIEIFEFGLVLNCLKRLKQKKNRCIEQRRLLRRLCTNTTYHSTKLLRGHFCHEYRIICSSAAGTCTLVLDFQTTSGIYRRTCHNSVPGWRVCPKTLLGRGAAIK
jgi:hypothetical protein